MRTCEISDSQIGLFIGLVLVVFSVLDVWENARIGAWGWFWATLFATVFWSGIVGWMAIDEFNRWLRK